tara:strand:- start:2768 stop:3703 length:936 start_codon:yes stop_codon:yes gene_type:complete
MPIPTTNTSLEEIQDEFGGSNPISLSEYYSGGANVPAASPAPNGPIPSSGQISCGQFRGAENFPFILANGGSTEDNGGYRIHTFTSGGTFQVTGTAVAPSNNNIEYIIGAGGGGCIIGQFQGQYVGGGGAGGLRTGSTPASVTSYPVTIGSGSNSGTGGSTAVFGVTSSGGGRGGGQDVGGSSGGSGGGGGGGASSGGGSGSSGQGNSGGTGGGGFDSGGGGGGGKNASGQNQPGAGQNGGQGGAGYQVTWGSSNYYVAGGGGGQNGSLQSADTGNNPTGGGGGNYSGGNNARPIPAAGGGGIVVVRYPIA